MDFIVGNKRLLDLCGVMHLRINELYFITMGEGQQSHNLRKYNA